MPRKLKRVYEKLPAIREAVQELRAQRKIIGRSVTPKSPVFFEVVEMVTSQVFAKRLKAFFDQGKKRKHRGSDSRDARNLKNFTWNIGKAVRESFVAGKER